MHQSIQSVNRPIQPTKSTQLNSNQIKSNQSIIPHLNDVRIQNTHMSMCFFRPFAPRQRRKKRPGQFGPRCCSPECRWIQKFVALEILDLVGWSLCWVVGSHRWFLTGPKFRDTGWWWENQLRLVVEIPLFTGFYTSQVVGNGISAINRNIYRWYWWYKLGWRNRKKLVIFSYCWQNFSLMLKDLVSTSWHYFMMGLFNCSEDRKIVEQSIFRKILWKSSDVPLRFHGDLILKYLRVQKF